MDRADASGGSILTKKKLGQAAGLFALGAVAGLGQAPFDLWPAAILGFATIFYVMGRSSEVQSWWIGFGYFALVLHWIVEPFLVDIARHGWMAPFALLFMSGGLALFWGAAGWMASRCAPAGPWRSVAFAAALVIAEFLRANILTGFPWGLPAYSLTQSGLLPAAGTWGPHGLGALMFALCCGLTLVAQRVYVAGAALAASALMLAIFPLATLPLVPSTPDPAILRIVQPNAPQHEKWQQDRARVFLDRQLDFTAAESPADLVIWPETSVAYNYNDVAPLAAQAARGGTVIFGAQRFADSRFFNALITVNAAGEVAHVYDKHHLVPFGEYIPLGNQLGKLGLRGLAENDGGGFASGPRPTPFDIPKIGSVLPLICYESIFPSYSRTTPSGDPATATERTNLIIVATNDAWFGQFAGPQQHLQQAQWRAAERRIPVARAANTGISAMIDARGNIVASLGLGQAGYFDVALPPPAPQGLFARADQWVNFGLIGLCLLGLFTLWRKNRMKK